MWYCEQNLWDRKRSNCAVAQEKSSDDGKKDDDGGRAKQVKQRSRKFNDDFCSTCLGKDVELYCGGKCRRSFHVLCVHSDSRPSAGSQSSDGANWMCRECRAGEAFCSFCGEIGSIRGESRQTGTEPLAETAVALLANVGWNSGHGKEDEKGKGKKTKKKKNKKKKREAPELIGCRSGSCGKFYHRECFELARAYAASRGRAALESGEATTALTPVPVTTAEGGATEESFLCPMHSCSKCLGSGCGKAMIKCVECPVAFHKAQVCRPVGLKETQISTKAYLCSLHSRDEVIKRRRSMLAIAEATRRGIALDTRTELGKKPKAGPFAESSWVVKEEAKVVVEGGEAVVEGGEAVVVAEAIDGADVGASLDATTAMAPAAGVTLHVDPIPITIRTYCNCGATDDDEDYMIECSSGADGPCGGWIHPPCTGVTKAQVDVAEKSTNWRCPICVSTGFVRGQAMVSEKR